MNLIKIGCPNCGSVLSVPPQPNIESKNVTCPVCKNRAPFTSYKLKSAAPSGDATSYGQRGSQPVKSGRTEIQYGKLNLNTGVISVPSMSLAYPLRKGRNVIGRKGAESSADFQIPAASKRMSREHLVIDVEFDKTVGYRHIASLYKEKVNDTFIGADKLEYGDRIVLTHGQTIKLPDLDIRFTIPDSDGTVM